MLGSHKSHTGRTHNGNTVTKDERGLKDEGKTQELPL